MDRLTQTAPHSLDTFTRCQLCGHESRDICEFRFWQECDENDKPEPYNILIVCVSNAECSTLLKEHPRLYVELPWSRGQPGHLSLLCGECSCREGVRCTHPDLKANGGEGLDLAMAGDLMYRAIVCFHDENDETGELRCRKLQPPFVECTGLPANHPRYLEIKKSQDTSKDKEHG